ncbi:hypothetical protein DM01DRAFT_1052616 [Hesseltinella vesiculosa]|uniref:G-protein coupled receptors family 1 profile domain-containing protein n=1 Tax=Hesseltinella vesiculosa TaxID=101127 RepID=A0A1X2GGI9_9FUNG|nr:hypothetical protein DM01DRAFT_1052616 [Hesseltinella vesiculosa]
MIWRIIVQKQVIFSFEEGWPRPKPIECMCLCGLLFNFVRIVHACVLLTKAGPSPALRLFLFDLCWVFAFWAFTCYVFGVAQTLLMSNRTLYDLWLKTSPKFVDKLGLFTTLFPVLFLNIGSIGSGIYAASGNGYMANVFMRVGYLTAAIYTLILGIFTIFIGRRLLVLLNSPKILKTHHIRVKSSKLRSNAIKVKATVVIAAFALWAMGMIATLFACVRAPIISNYILAMFCSAFVSFIGPGFSSLILLAFVLYPRLITGMAILSISNERIDYPRVEFGPAQKKPATLEAFPKDSRFRDMGDDDIFSTSANFLVPMSPVNCTHPDPSEENYKSTVSNESQTMFTHFSHWQGVDAQTLIEPSPFKSTQHRS